MEYTLTFGFGLSEFENIWLRISKSVFFCILENLWSTTIEYNDGKLSHQQHLVMIIYLSCDNITYFGECELPWKTSKIFLLMIHLMLSSRWLLIENRSSLITNVYSFLCVWDALKKLLDRFSQNIAPLLSQYCHFVIIWNVNVDWPLKFPKKQ